MIVTLEIRSWSLFANCRVHHFYGVLKAPGHRPVRLDKVVTAQEAESLNVYDNTPGAYHEGSTTERFASVEEVVDKANEVWEDLFPHGCMLMVKEIPECLR